MAELIINCANDQDLAVALYSHLLSNLYPIDKSSFELEKDEIYIYEKKDNLASEKKNIIKAIRSFINTTRIYENYEIREFDNNVIVATRVRPEELMENVLTCDMCNYMTLYEEQLWLHRMTHGNIMIG